jgi:large subunit ribosomal protein L10
MILEAKKQQVAEIKATVESACAGVLVDYSGISVADDTKLRKELREAGIKYTVVKNTLLRKAIEGTDLAEIEPFLNGNTALATSEDDQVSAARILNKYAEANDSFTIKTGFLDGKVIDTTVIESLAKLPTRDILLATVCNAFNAPISAFARVIQAIVDKDGEATPAAE